MTDADLLDIVARIVIIDRAQALDIQQCEHAGLPILEACERLYGWNDPHSNIARGEMNAVQFVQALQIARHQPGGPR